MTRSIEILSSYDFIIKYQSANSNPADGLSRQPDYEIGYQRPKVWLLVLFTAVDTYNGVQLANKATQDADTLATDVGMNIVNIPKVGYPGLTENGGSEGTMDWHMKWTVIPGALTNDGRVYTKYSIDSSGKWKSECLKCNYWYSSKWDTEELWYTLAIGPKWDSIRPLSQLKSLPNGITRDSEDIYCT